MLKDKLDNPVRWVMKDLPQPVAPVTMILCALRM